MDFIVGIYSFIMDVWRDAMNAPTPLEAGLIIMFNGGWVFVVAAGWDAFKAWWLNKKRNEYHNRTRKFILLAIDVPRDNEQSPRAVEGIFNQLHGALPGANTLWQTWGLGKTVDYFSLEIVSIDGYVQFLIYAMEDYRDLVESAFYAQYPDAEITEVEDYVDGPNGDFVNLNFPNDKYDIFGTEFILAKNNAFPIRLWKDFEHTMSAELKDPMASLLESMNKIGPGEQLWFQIVVTPEYGKNWITSAHKQAYKIAGKKIEEKKAGLMDSFLGGALEWLDTLGGQIFPFYNAGGAEEKKKDDLPSLMLHLTPGEKSQIEGIEMKADKPGFWCKMRYIYIGQKKVFSRARVVAPMLGAIRQYDSYTNNNLTLHKYTKTSGIDYWLTKYRMSLRKNKILRAIQGRSRAMGSYGIILNTEELSTVYHFPVITVKAPLVSRTEAKRASAPISLPLETPSPFARFKTAGYAKAPAPASLPEPLPEPTIDATTPPVNEPSVSVPDNLPFV